MLQIRIIFEANISFLISWTGCTYEHSPPVEPFVRGLWGVSLRKCFVLGCRFFFLFLSKPNLATPQYFSFINQNYASTDETLLYTICNPSIHIIMSNLSNFRWKNIKNVSTFRINIYGRFIPCCTPT